MTQKECCKFVKWCRKMDISCSATELSENFEKYYNAYYDSVMNKRLIYAFSVISIANFAVMLMNLFLHTHN